MEAAIEFQYEQELLEITKGEPFDQLSDEILDKVNAHYNSTLSLVYQKTGVEVYADSGKPTEVKNTEESLMWKALHALFHKRIEAAKAHWAQTHQVHLKLDDLEATLAEKSVGLGGAMLFHADGYGRWVETYVINGITGSRFSHTGLVMPLSEYPHTPAIWQSGYDGNYKLGEEGETRIGPDMSDMKKIIVEFVKKGYRFVFRPLKEPLNDARQQKAVQYVYQLWKDESLGFPSALVMAWTFLISRYPRLLRIAAILGIDAGVVEGKYKNYFCSMLNTSTLSHCDVLASDTKAGQFAPGDYGLPYDTVGNGKIYGDEYEFIFDDISPN